MGNGGICYLPIFIFPYQTDPTEVGNGMVGKLSDLQSEPGCRIVLRSPRQFFSEVPTRKAKKGNLTFSRRGVRGSRGKTVGMSMSLH